MRTTLALLLCACADGATTDVGADTDTDPVAVLDGDDGVLPPVCIGEFMASNVAAWVVDTDQTPDWIELQNATDAEVLLDGWLISDDLDLADKHTLPDGLAVPAGGQLVLFATGDVTLGDDHLPFKLDKGGEALLLTAPDGAADGLSYGPQAEDVSLARTEPCCQEATCWLAVPGGTPDAPNE